MSMSNFNNKTVVITRPIERADILADMVIKQGGKPLIIPTLELQLVESEELLYIANNIDDFDWIIFTSPAGVKSFFNTYKSDKIPCNIAVIGVKTEEELLKYGDNKPKLLPEKFTAEGLLEAFESIDIKDKKIALPRTLSARKVLPEGLEKRGADVLVAEAYTSAIPKDKTLILDLLDKLLDGEVDIITFTSPLTFTNLIKIIEEEKAEKLDDLIYALKNNVIVGSIGPITGNVIKKYDIETIEPEQYTVKNMIDAILQNIN
ncbi:uroporphyrinogen-III synthase [Methanosphaera sp.]